MVCLKICRILGYLYSSNIHPHFEGQSRTAVVSVLVVSLSILLSVFGGIYVLVSGIMNLEKKQIFQREINETIKQRE